MKTMGISKMDRQRDQFRKEIPEIKQNNCPVFRQNVEIQNRNIWQNRTKKLS